MSDPFNPYQQAVGAYGLVGFSHDMGMGVYEAEAYGDVLVGNPIDALWGQIIIQEQNGLRVMTSGSQAIFQAALLGLSLALSTSSMGDGVSHSGIASVATGSAANAMKHVNDMLTQGFVVVAQEAPMGATSFKIDFVKTAKPLLDAAAVGTKGSVFAGPVATVLATPSLNLPGPGTPVPSPGTPAPAPGPVSPAIIIPSVTPPAPTSPAVEQKKTIPSWFWPVAVGAGVLTVSALLISARKD